VTRRTSMNSIDPLFYRVLDFFPNSKYFKSSTNSMQASMRLQIGNEYNDEDKRRFIVVGGSQSRSINFFGMKWEICQQVPYAFFTPIDLEDPGRLTVSLDMALYRHSIGEPWFESIGFDFTELFKGIFGDNPFEFYVLSTDYDNYAIIWACKQITTNGKCGENMALVMSRGVSLKPFHESIVKAKLASICIDYDTLIEEEQSGNLGCKSPDPPPYNGEDYGDYNYNYRNDYS